MKITPCGRVRPKLDVKVSKKTEEKEPEEKMFSYGCNKYPYRAIKKIIGFASTKDFRKAYGKNVFLTFKEGDEVWVYDDFDIAPFLCGRSFLFHARAGKVINAELLRMS